MSPGASGPARAGAKLADLGLRVRSSALLAALVGVPILIGGWLGALALAAVAAAAGWEWRRITLGLAYERVLVGVYAAVTGLGALLAHAVSIGAAALYFIGAGAALAALDRFEKRDPRWAPLGFATVGLAVASFAALRAEPVFGLATALWLAAVVVSADTGAYFAGRAVGGPKLWPRVSPNKTWAGLVGAALAAAIVGALFSWATTGTYALQVGTVSALAAVVAQGGDLAESSLKRRFGVKDSSDLIPGHGGALDRLDGFIAATLVAAAVTFLRGKPVFVW